MIRGEELAQRPLNPTLATAQQFGMQLEFISRNAYRQKDQPDFCSTCNSNIPIFI